MDAKRLLRSRLIAARAARTAADLAAAEAAVAGHGAAAWSRLRQVAAFAAVGTEPPTRALLDRLADAGVEVLLPVVAETNLQWAPYSGWDNLTAGPLGLLEPDAAPLATGIASTQLVVVPALAVDRHGNRLGRGKGYYDRALAAVDPQRVVAVVFDDEVLDEVPTEPHDRRVGGVLTPSGLQQLGR